MTLQELQKEIENRKNSILELQEIVDFYEPSEELLLAENAIKYTNDILVYLEQWLDDKKRYENLLNIQYEKFDWGLD